LDREFVSIIGLVLFRQNHLYVKDDVLQGILLFRRVSEDSACKSENLRFPVNHLKDHAILSGRSYVHCSIRPDNVPSDRPSIIRPDNIYFRPDLHCFKKLLFQLASVRTSQQPVRTPLSDRSASDSFQVQFKGRLLQPSGRRGFPSGRAHI
jgi:hypothetical protein